MTRILLTAVYDSGMDERVLDLLDRLHIEGWTRLFGAHGCGGTGLRMDNPIWPGTLNILYVLGSREELEKLATELRELPRSYRRNPGLTMWLTPADER